MKVKGKEEMCAFWQHVIIAQWGALWRNTIADLLQNLIFVHVIMESKVLLKNLFLKNVFNIFWHFLNIEHMTGSYERFAVTLNKYILICILITMNKYVVLSC